jgi:hypothetical protein
MPMMFFYFLKIIFDISTSKRSKKYKPHSILAKKKNLNLHKTQVQTQYQTFSKSYLEIEYYFDFSREIEKKNTENDFFIQMQYFTK